MKRPGFVRVHTIEKSFQVIHSFIHGHILWDYGVRVVCRKRDDGSSAFSICDGTGAFEEMMAMAWFCVLYGNICR